MSTIAQFLPLIFILALAFGIALTIKSRSKKYPPAEVSSGQPSGVGGWLLLLILGLTFLGPLLVIGRTAGDLRAAEVGSPALLGAPGWQSYKFSIWAVVATTCALTFYAGMGLLRRRDPRVVRRAVIILWLTSPVALIIKSIFLPFIFLGGAVFDAKLATAMATGLLVAGVWTSYLYCSKRVRFTYRTSSTAP